MYRIERFSNEGMIVAVFLIVLFSIVPSAAALGGCMQGVGVELDSTHRGLAEQGSKRFLFDVETPGIVTVEISTAARSALRLAAPCGPFAERPLERQAALLEASPTHLAFAAPRPGTYGVDWLASSEPMVSRYKLTTSFVAAEIVEEVLETGTGRGLETAWYLATPESGSPPLFTLLDVSGPISARVVLLRDESLSKAEDHEVDPDPFQKAEDHEVDPDPFQKAYRTWTARISFPVDPDPFQKAEDHEVDPDPFQKAEDHEVDPDPFGKAEDHEVDPDPFVKSPGEAGRWIRFADLGARPAAVLSEWLSQWTGQVDSSWKSPRRRILESTPLSEAAMLLLGLGERCRGGVDDHADTFACATPVALGSRRSAELANGWGDDEDVWRFELETPRTVGIAAAGAAVRLDLFDRSGRRLEASEADGGEVLIVRELSTGEYFVRVAGAVPGPYELLLE